MILNPLAQTNINNVSLIQYWGCKNRTQIEFSESVWGECRKAKAKRVKTPRPSRALGADRPALTARKVKARLRFPAPSVTTKPVQEQREADYKNHWGVINNSIWIFHHCALLSSYGLPD
jgi:hypothetical protein